MAGQVIITLDLLRLLRFTNILYLVREVDNEIYYLQKPAMA